ncbi:MAG: hypothetical protein QXY62_04905 [Candidatus Altiarchaeota archaeon]
MGSLREIREKIIYKNIEKLKSTKDTDFFTSLSLEKFGEDIGGRKDDEKNSDNNNEIKTEEGGSSDGKANNNNNIDLKLFEKGKDEKLDKLIEESKNVGKILFFNSVKNSLSNPLSIATGGMIAFVSFFLTGRISHALLLGSLGWISGALPDLIKYLKIAYGGSSPAEKLKFLLEEAEKKYKEGSLTDKEKEQIENFKRNLKDYTNQTILNAARETGRDVARKVLEKASKLFENWGGWLGEIDKKSKDIEEEKNEAENQQQQPMPPPPP